MTRPGEPPRTSVRRLSWRTKFLIVVAVVVAIPVVLFRLRYCRTVVFRDLNTMQTKTVTVGAQAASMTWSVAGNVQGTGALIISHDFSDVARGTYVYSNNVSGRFVANGGGDWYTANATVTFIPNGPAKGKIRASFNFHEFFGPGAWFWEPFTW